MSKRTRREFLKDSGKAIAGGALLPKLATMAAVLSPEYAEAVLNNTGAFWKQSGGYQIAKSLRIDKSRSSYMSRTPGTAGNQKTFTVSFWFKPCDPGTSSMPLFSVGTASTDRFLIMNNSGMFQVIHSVGGSNLGINTNRQFRDTAAWYHIVVAVDTTQATAANRFILYVNGVQETSLSSATYPAQNTLTYCNGTVLHTLGKSADPYYSHTYVSELYVIDGQALTPSAFGYFANTGQWAPRQYTGTFGTNGCYLPFTDNSAVNGSGTGTGSYPNVSGVTGLGADWSGRNNHWSGSGVAVTDQLVDTPSNNYCVLNSLNAPTTGGSSYSWALSNGNLNYLTADTGTGHYEGTMAVSSGKWYWELTSTSSLNQDIHGVVPTGTDRNDYGWNQTNAVAYYGNNGCKYISGSFTAYGATYGASDVIGVALNMDAGTITFYKNGTSQGNITLPKTGINLLPLFADGSAGASTGATSGTANFGQGGVSGLTWYANAKGFFKYAPPTGFKALCSANLSQPAVVRPNKYFNTALYTGTGAAQSITGLGFKPDLVWIKNRSSAVSHCLIDSARGPGKYLFADLTSAEGSYPTDLISFDKDGFSLGSGVNTGDGANGANYVAWCWGKSAAAGIDVVAFSKTTASGSSQTFNHSLGVAPSVYIVKARNEGAANWAVYHSSIAAASPENYYVELNTTAGRTSNTGYWGVAPTATQFTLAGGWGIYNYIAYLFAEVPGFSRFGIYTGNGSNDGTFVWCGFKPAFLMVKRVDTSGDNWIIADAKRNATNPLSALLDPNLSGAEATTACYDFLSNGFKLRYSGSGVNGSGASYIFLAFAEAPFKYATAK